MTVSSFVAKSLTAIVAFPLLYSGLIHIAQPYQFIHSAAAYRVLPVSTVGPLMTFLPYLQTAVALCLLMGVAERAALLFASLLFGSFAAAQAVVLARGESLSCGCFGFSGMTIGPLTLSIPILCGVICLVALTRNIKGTQSPPRWVSGAASAVTSGGSTHDEAMGKRT